MALVDVHRVYILGWVCLRTRISKLGLQVEVVGNGDLPIVYDRLWNSGLSTLLSSHFLVHMIEYKLYEDSYIIDGPRYPRLVQIDNNPLILSLKNLRWCRGFVQRKWKHRIVQKNLTG